MPSRIVHAVLLEERISETLCHMQIRLVATVNGKPIIESIKVPGRKVHAVWARNIADFDCKTCQIVWRNITRGL